MRAPVRGGLKGGRRSVKRGQSVEFADYRDYTLGDDLRQLDWNVYARLEKLFVKLFVEEEDVTITLLIDASASMATGTPDKLLFAKRAAAALGYIGLASRGPRSRSARWPVATARRRAALRGSGRVFRLLADLSAIAAGGRPDRPRWPPPGTPARSSHGRGVVVLLSRPARPGRRQGHPRAGRDRLRADRPPRPLARRARPAARGRPPARRRRDRRRASTSPSTSRRSTPTRRGSRPGRPGFADLAAKRRATLRRPVVATLPLADLMFAELRRRRVVLG